MEIGVAAFALVLAGYSLIANRLDKLSIGPALTFVAVGLVLGPVVLGVLHVDVESSTIRHLSELTLALVLFTDASTVDIAGLRRDAGLIGRLLGIGLLLTIAAGGLVGALVFPELPLATALLIGAILAPTDAALGLPVITNPAVPTRVRRILNVESGLNDGIATPFVLLFIALATAAAGSEGHHLADALVEIAIAVVVGIGIGAIGGRLLMAADRRELASGLSRQIAVLALALGGYFASVALGGNGFIAAFVAGLAFGAVTRHAEERAELFSEVAGILLSVAVWTVFGATFVGALLRGSRDLRPVLYADPQPDGHPDGPGGDRAGRQRPGASDGRVHRLVRTARTGVDRVRDPGCRCADRGRGGVRRLASTVAWTVLLSVIAHGADGAVLARGMADGSRLRRQTSGEPLPELEEQSEPRPSARSTWTRRQAPTRDGP